MEKSLIKVLLKMTAQHLRANVKNNMTYKDYLLVDWCISANEECIDLLLELGYVTESKKVNHYKFTQKALEILNEEECY